MKKVCIVAVGKIKEEYLKEGIKEYSKRLLKFCDFSILETVDCPIVNQAKTKEADEIFKKPKGYNIVTDIDGEMVSSEELARILDKAYSLGNSNVNFIIGGSYGLDDSVKISADKKISFGKVTYPHQLMRLILTEQIYRAFNILENTPYHK